ncbi:hypothetical protein ABW19_dt0207521 [Dactylella cylindrospora]|nr:hypothetical protein ABW19_dt0207521 [Dactylella cylindrospora]
METLTALPFELTSEISSYLEDQDDFLALRMTCKNLNAKLKEVHLNSIYRCRVVRYHPVSLQNLIKISQHPSGMNLRVKKLIITTDSIIITGKFKSNLSSYQAWKDSWVIPEGGTHWREFLESLTSPSEPIPQSEHYVKSKAVELALSVAFANLPNVEFMECPNYPINLMTRSDFNLFLPSYGLGPGTHFKDAKQDLPKSIQAGTPLNTSMDYQAPEVFEKSLLMGMRHKLGLRSLKCSCSMVGTPLSWFQYSDEEMLQFQTAFGNIRTLEIRLESTTFIDHAHAKHAQRVGKFFQWVEAVGGKAEELAISKTFPPENADSLYFPDDVSIPQDLKVPNLRSLILRDFALDMNDLKSFLKRNPQLDELLILSCYFGYLREGELELTEWMRDNCQIRGFLVSAYDRDRRVVDGVGFERKKVHRLWRARGPPGKWRSDLLATLEERLGSESDRYVDEKLFWQLKSSYY